jgi:mRNA interferase HigB
MGSINCFEPALGGPSNTLKVKDGRAVFNIAGNKYRIVVWINYAYRVVYIRLIGTHRHYDAIDAETV